MSKEKQIDELRGVLWLNPYVRLGSHNAHMIAQYLHNEGYRKQSVGEWIKHGYKWRCSNCGSKINLDGTPLENGLYYCSKCGAKMKGV